MAIIQLHQSMATPTFLAPASNAVLAWLGSGAVVTLVFGGGVEVDILGSGLAHADGMALAGAVSGMAVYSAGRVLCGELQVAGPLWDFTSLFDGGFSGLFYGATLEMAGSDGADSMTGGDAADAFVPGDGADHVLGGAGSDSFTLQAAYMPAGLPLWARHLDGESGVDRLVIQNAYGAAGGVDLTASTLLGFEQVDLRNGATLRITSGDIGPARLRQDAVIYGDGVIEVQQTAGQAITLGSWVVPGSARFVLRGSAQADSQTGHNVSADLLEGMGGADVLRGQGGADTLRGGAGADMLLAGAGDDRMEGGTGDDRYYVDAVGDVVIELAEGGFDTVYSTVDVTLTAEVEVGIITALAGRRVVGNGMANRLEGNYGADTLTGGLGADTLLGGVGADVYVVNSAQDSVIEAAGGGVDRVESWASFVLPDWVERGILKGSANRDLTGNDLANRLTGNSGANVLIGGEGADRLRGMAGKDEMVGGNGADRFVFGTGDGADKIIDFQAFGSGQDRVDLSPLDTVTGWADLSRSHLRQAVGRVVLDGGNGDTLVLRGVKLADLDAADFIFG